MSWKRLMVWTAGFTLTVGLLAPGPARTAAAAAGILDGKAFAGETGEKGKATGDQEEFVFAGGVFDPLACHQYGFRGAPYTATVAGDAVRFAAATPSDKEGVMQWTGTVRGDHIEGTMVWTKAGQAPAEYWFRGDLKKAR